VFVFYHLVTVLVFKLFIFTVVKTKNLGLNKLMYGNLCRGPDLPWYSWNCTKFGKLILRKIIVIAATRRHILKLKCPNSISAGAPLQTR